MARAGRQRDVDYERLLAAKLEKSWPRLAMLMADESVDVLWRQSAMRALAKLGGPAALSRIGAMLDDADPSMRTCAVCCIGRKLRQPEATPYLEAGLSNSHAQVVMWAIIFLSRRGALTESTAISLSRGSESNPRVEAIRALRRFRSPAAAAALRTSIRAERGFATRVAMRAYLQVCIRRMLS